MTWRMLHYSVQRLVGRFPKTALPVRELWGPRDDNRGRAISTEGVLKAQTTATATVRNTGGAYLRL